MTPPGPERKRIRAVVFDLDGVLVSSVEAHYRAYRDAFREAGVDFRREDYERVARGAPREEVIRAVLGDIPRNRFEALMRLKEARMRVHLDRGGLEPIPGAREFVAEVRARGLKTAVATASRTPDLLLGAAGFPRLFDAVIDRTCAARSKPAPDLYLAAAEALQVAPEECLAFEDSPAGVEAARAAGMRVIALTTTHGREDLTNAHAVYSGFGEIPLEEWIG